MHRHGVHLACRCQVLEVHCIAGSAAQPQSGAREVGFAAFIVFIQPNEQSRFALNGAGGSASLWSSYSSPGP